jgi:hypothetical protein
VFYVGFAVSIGISRLLIGGIGGSAGELIGGLGFMVFVEFWLVRVNKLACGCQYPAYPHIPPISSREMPVDTEKPT